MKSSMNAVVKFDDDLPNGPYAHAHGEEYHVFLPPNGTTCAHIRETIQPLFDAQQDPFSGLNRQYVYKPKVTSTMRINGGTYKGGPIDWDAPVNEGTYTLNVETTFNQEGGCCIVQ